MEEIKRILFFIETLKVTGWLAVLSFIEYFNAQQKV
jgi:hypothetical protein